MLLTQTIKQVAVEVVVNKFLQLSLIVSFKEWNAPVHYVMVDLLASAVNIALGCQILPPTNTLAFA